MSIDPIHVRKLFKRATETGDWQYRATAWLELDDACPCYECCERDTPEL